MDANRDVMRIAVRDWPSLTAHVQEVLLDRAHASGEPVSRLRLDVPPPLAGARPEALAALLAWCRAEGIVLVVLGSRRADVRIEVS